MTVGEDDVGSAGDGNSVGAGVCEGEALEADVGGVGQGKNRGCEEGRDGGAGGERGGGPEVEIAGGAVEVPFAGFVEFFEEVEGAPALAGLVAEEALR